MGDERNIFLSTMPATRGDRIARARRGRRLGGAVRLRRAVCRRAAHPGPGLRCELSVRPGHQRPDHRRPAVFAVRDFPLAGAAAAGERIFVHGHGGHRSRPDLSRPVRPRRAARRRNADHRLALHGLARRISASGPRLFAAERQDNGSKIRGSTSVADRYEHRRGCCRDGRVSPGSSPPSTTCLPILAEPRSLHARHALGGIDACGASASRRWSRCGSTGRTPCSTSG